MTMQIRFNTNYPEKSPHKWRLLIDGEQTLVDEVYIMVPSWTTTDKLSTGEVKHHITVKASKLEIVETEGRKIATIK